MSHSTADWTTLDGGLALFKTRLPPAGKVTNSFSTDGGYMVTARQPRLRQNAVIKSRASSMRVARDGIQNNRYSINKSVRSDRKLRRV